MPTAGCDYSASEAYLALSDNEKVLHTVKVKLSGDNPEQLRNYFQNLVTMLETLKEEFKLNDNVYIEEPWIAGRHFPQAALKLARNASFIEMAIVWAGMKPVKVHIATWRKAIYGHGKPQDTKGTAIGWVLYNLGYETKNHNYAEAACIATYGERKNGRE